jgi:hypothetical protein
LRKDYDLLLQISGNKILFMDCRIANRALNLKSVNYRLWWRTMIWILFKWFMVRLRTPLKLIFLLMMMHVMILLVALMIVKNMMLMTCYLVIHCWLLLLWFHQSLRNILEVLGSDHWVRWDILVEESVNVDRI